MRKGAWEPITVRPVHGATRLHQDRGEMASLHWCGSFQQEQTPHRKDPGLKMNLRVFLFSFIPPRIPSQKKKSTQAKLLPLDTA